MSTDSLKSKGKCIRIPAFFPVLFPMEISYKLEEKLRPLLIQATNQVLISSYNFLIKPTLKNDVIMKKIVENSFVFLDSGGFLIRNIRKDGNEIKVTFDNLTINWEKILELQNSMSNIGNNIDLIPRKNPKKELLSLNWYLIDLYVSSSKNFLFFPTIHVNIINNIAYYIKKLKSSNQKYDGISIGGVVYLKNRWESILSRIIYVRSFFNDIPIHTFGIGNPSLVAILFSLGITSVDSTSYIKYALNGQYIDPSSFKLINLRSISFKRFPCDCKICTTFDVKDIITLGNLGKVYLAIHNLHTYHYLCEIFWKNDDRFLKKILQDNSDFRRGTRILEFVKRERKLL